MNFFKTTSTVGVEYKRNTGLGNKLFPWSRAVILAEKHDIPLLYNLWFSPKGAGITRGGIDYSTIFGKQLLLGNFKRHIKEMGFLASVYYYFKQRTLLINDLNSDLLITDLLHNRNINMKFKWNESHSFSDIVEYRSLIKKNILTIVDPVLLSDYYTYLTKKFIVFNVRCGNDFVDAFSNDSGYKKTSLSFFVEQYHAIRARLGSVSIVIISDGSEKQLSNLLLDDNVSMLKSKHAITDLLIMSLAMELYGSGNSTFSAWASFLGDMPTYSSKLTPFTHFNLPNTREL